MGETQTQSVDVTAAHTVCNTAKTLQHQLELKSESECHQRNIKNVMCNSQVDNIYNTE